MKYCKTRKAWVGEEKQPCGRNVACAGASKGFRCAGHNASAINRGQQAAEFERMLSENALSFSLSKAARTYGDY